MRADIRCGRRPTSAFSRPPEPGRSIRLTPAREIEPVVETLRPAHVLPYTWSAFFARHGSLTPVQQQAIPPILEGYNTLVIAPTAAGKTEAVIAPLLERHVLGGAAPADGQHPGLRILYICPTRALVRDLYERLAPPLAQLQVTLGMKSGDTGPVSASRPPTVLITTPESTDSLLTREPRLLAGLQAMVLDEIHLFDGGVRGDHLRCLLRRVQQVRRYSQQQAGVDPPIPMQRIALSATIPDPAGVARRYLADDEAAGTPRIVEAGGGRAIEADMQPMHGLADLATSLARRASGRLGMRKTLVFCNSRNEVEQTAAYLRQHLPFEAAVFVHYSNLDPAERRAVEDGFAQASVAVCVASSTLELGIDIGSIDDVALVGPPPTLTSFLQRIGRGGRRTGLTRVLCLPRSSLEQVRFAALLALAQSAPPLPLSPSPSLPLSPSPPPPPFRPSVLVQQSFSLLKQSPTGALRLADLRRVAPAEVEDAALRQILDHLTALDFLRRGGLGEWRPAPRLHDLADRHEIYSNIGADPLALQVVDAFSGRVIAQTGQMRSPGETFLLGGRLLEVVWRDRYRLGVRPVAGQPVEEVLRFVTVPFAVPLEVSQAVAAQLGLAPGQMALVHEETGALLYHFWGDLYGALLAAMLQAGLAEEDGGVVRVHEHCLRLPAGLVRLPPWDDALAHAAARRLMPELQPYLELGRFHALLPPDLAYQAALAQLDLPRLEALYRAAALVSPPAGLRL
jgi:ATP-dependent Lhr-like helicase